MSVKYIKAREITPEFLEHLNLSIKVVSGGHSMEQTYDWEIDGEIGYKVSRDDEGEVINIIIKATNASIG
ncbi:hypothetical protein LCGC14_1119440 [marine sediment metagenome]|uniref:Uncharacterized protein n=1 Tax=marine sediment metagenome TaxID=412755 RepID=A0A0F9PMM3_9ZZZZ